MHVGFKGVNNCNMRACKQLIEQVGKADSLLSQEVPVKQIQEMALK